MIQKDIHVQELLEILCRQEEKVNYVQIKKCLLNLKHAQWIRKYRARRIWECYE